MRLTRSETDLGLKGSDQIIRTLGLARSPSLERDMYISFDPGDLVRFSGFLGAQPDVENAAIDLRGYV